MWLCLQGCHGRPLSSTVGKTLSLALVPEPKWFLSAQETVHPSQSTTILNNSSTSVQHPYYPSSTYSRQVKAAHPPPDSQSTTSHPPSPGLYSPWPPGFSVPLPLLPPITIIETCHPAWSTVLAPLIHRNSSLRDPLLQGDLQGYQTNNQGLPRSRPWQQ